MADDEVVHGFERDEGEHEGIIPCGRMKDEG
jgi:hypothetical protein